MNRIIMAMLFVVMLNSASAQWGYGYYNPNVMMDPCVQSSIRAAQSSNWVMQQNQVIMQQQQMMMNKGWYSVPFYQKANRWCKPPFSKKDNVRNVRWKGVDS